MLGMAPAYSRAQYQGAALEMGCVEAVSKKVYEPGIRMKWDEDTNHLLGTFRPMQPRGYAAIQNAMRDVGRMVVEELRRKGWAPEKKRIFAQQTV